MVMKGLGWVGARLRGAGVVNVLLGCAVLAAAGVGYVLVDGGRSSGATLRTTTVQRGTVLQTVSASGNLEPVNQAGLNFASSGTVTAVDVAVGQHVAAGQVLATIDPTAAKSQLETAEANLAGAQQNLDKALHPLTAQAQAVVQDQLAQSGLQIQQADNSLAQAKQSAASQASADAATVNTATTALADAEARLSSDEQAEKTACSAGGPAGGTATPGSCPQYTAAVASDKQAVAQDTTALQTAQQNQTNDAQKSQQTIENAQLQVTSANDSYNTQVAQNALNAAPATSATIAQDTAQVTAAQLTVAQDKKALQGTTITAPFSGTIASISGSVGETVSGGSSSGGSGSSSSSSSSSSSASGFIVLDSFTRYQVTADFPEVDAVDLAGGQGAVVTLQAVSGVSINAKVTAVSPVPTVVSNVVEYPVTVALENAPSDLRPGETVNVEVIVKEADNALYLPSSAVTTRGGTSTVTAMVNGKRTTVTVGTGVVGTSDTQITSGLTQGETVVLASTSGSTSSGFPGGGGFGGGGIAGLGRIVRAARGG